MPSRTDARLKRYETFTSAAAIAAHANAPAEGFRQRDLRFLIELFANWSETSFFGGELRLQNTQLSRYLTDLEQEGLAKRTVKAGHPRYRLTRIGLIELLSRLSNRISGTPADHFLFSYYFLKNYGPRVSEQIKREGRQFPPAMRLEIETLLDSTRILKEEIGRTEQEVRRIELRYNDSIKAEHMTRTLFRNGATIERVAEELEKHHPYELNSQRPLSELFASIPKDLARWELEEGSLRRAESLWKPNLLLAKGYLKVLRELDE